MAGPVSYELDGEQYVTVMAGWGGVFGLAFAAAVEPGLKVQAEARVLTFKLGGKARLPKPKLQPRRIPAPAKVTASAEQLAIGKDLYSGVCASCHGLAVIGNNLVPDLRYMDPKTQDEFVAIVSGSPAVRGMPAFGHVLPPAQIELIQQYVASRAQALLESIQPAQQ
jgi:quinohemoprotein ethanol dehydrogenase